MATIRDDMRSSSVPVEMNKRFNISNKRTVPEYRKGDNQVFNPTGQHRHVSKKTLE